MTDNKLTLWQSIEVLTKTILNMQKELSLIKNTASDQDVTLEKGKELSSGIYEANFKLNKAINIATLPKIGYYMLSGELVVRNHITKEEVKIPRDFHYLKVVKLNHDDYKLTFCNSLGNEFFEYKKYDPQYSRISDEYKFVDFGGVKKTYNLKLKEYVGHAPKFFAAEGLIEPGSENHVIDLFELARDGKGKKWEPLLMNLVILMIKINYTTIIITKVQKVILMILKALV